jgi:hypothetical protein
VKGMSATQSSPAMAVIVQSFVPGSVTVKECGVAAHGNR